MYGTATSYNVAGTYTYTTTSSAGCDSIATLILTVSNVTTSTTNITRCSNQLPYVWNGTSYNVAGTYTFNTTNAAGCDSIATLELIVSGVTTSTTNISRCSNQLPYTWNGTSYNVAGTYTFNTTNAAGCDSVATLVLTVSGVTTSTTNVARCSNQLPYTWNGTDYSASGTYTFNTTNAAGCDSVATLVLTISNTVTSTTNITRCSNQLPYNWNGTDYNTSGTYTFNTTSAAGCDSVATLVLTVSNTVTSSTSVNRCPNQLPYVWNGTSYNVGGTYTYTTTSSTGCDSIATLILTVSNVTTSTTNITRCSNQLPYNWNGTNYNTAGTYTFNTVNAAGCDSVATLVLAVSGVSTSTTSISRCSNQLPYTWNGTNYNAAGTYTFNTTNAAGCDSVATLVLTVSGVTTSTTNISRCSNQLPYIWNGTNYNVAGTYTFNTTNAAGCDSIATLVLAVSGVTTSTTNVSRCSNQLPYNWNGTNYNAGGTYTFNTTNAAGCDSVATLVLTVKNSTTSLTNVSRCTNQLPYVWNGVSYNTPGTYSFTTTNAAGCDSVATLVLTIKTTATSTINVAYCADQLPFIWNGTAYNTSGTYTFTTVNSAGCDSIATLNLFVKAVPTATLSGGGVTCSGTVKNLSVALTGTAPFTIVYTDGTNTYTVSSITSSPYQLPVTPTVNTTYTITSVSDATCVNKSVNSSVTVSVILPIPAVRYPTVETEAFRPTPLNARNLRKQLHLSMESAGWIKQLFCN